LRALTRPQNTQKHIKKNELRLRRNAYRVLGCLLAAASSGLV
jgi:hypothetical protein